VELLNYIVIDQTIRFEKLYIKGTRITVGDIFQGLSEGISVTVYFINRRIYGTHGHFSKLIRSQVYFLRIQNEYNNKKTFLRPIFYK
jgi:hypothetical protein